MEENLSCSMALAAMSQARAELGTRESTARTESSFFRAMSTGCMHFPTLKAKWHGQQHHHYNRRLFAKCHAGKLVRPDVPTLASRLIARGQIRASCPADFCFYYFTKSLILGFFFLSWPTRAEGTGQIVSIIDTLYRTCCHQLITADAFIRRQPG